MKIKHVTIHNFRSVHHADFDLYDYTMLVGANNSGKSTIINALRIFYEDSIKWSKDDLPKIVGPDRESWIELEFELNDDEFRSLPEKYQGHYHNLKVKKFLASEESPGRVKSGQSNIYAMLPDGSLEENLFFGAKSISQAKLGRVIYIPALSTPSENFKTTGASPFRNVISFLLKKVVENSKGYAALGTAFDTLNSEAKGEAGFLSQLINPMNTALSRWGVSMKLEVKPVTPEEIVKNQIAHAFQDENFDGDLSIDRFGHGFQRSVIYELIRLAPIFEDSKKRDKKIFDPDFTLLLFEEPEAFLHPNQQENLALSLRKLGGEANQQVLITTHSPVFVGKAAKDLKQIIRLHRQEGVSRVFQPSEQNLEELLSGANRLKEALEKFVNDLSIDDSRKAKARRLIASFPDREVAIQEDSFRFQLWLDGERASAFFSDKVIICEGATEKALLNYLLENDWEQFRSNSIFILDALGKYNFPRYLLLFEIFGIPHGVLLDGDVNRNEHEAINQLIHSLRGTYTIDIHQFEKDLEAFIGTEKPQSGRDDKKPIEVLKAISENRIDIMKISELQTIFSTICGIGNKENLL
ncbi:ATP-dependent nuclease [Tistrella mobilis]|uniref:ATP-dependent endonuclease of the OLD family protein n=1 Tax=Tistrella mobilis (strain KA081020-065) TaxID=1110502 RepID=I3TU15_TISMK|nr:AAA family ATPase [Tistrella mobilis]AFK56253.1 putative ATP-dependent endonuclease of the OLD family protein [Tistrella mobilis KA081020-065]